jgi:hypothetical protein
MNLDPLVRLANLRYLRFAGGSVETRDFSALLRCKELESVEWHGYVYVGRQGITDFVLGK